MSLPSNSGPGRQPGTDPPERRRIDATTVGVVIGGGLLCGIAGGVVGVVYGWRGGVSRHSSHNLDNMLADTPEAATLRFVIGAVIGAVVGVVGAIRLMRPADDFVRRKERVDGKKG